MMPMEPDDNKRILPTGLDPVPECCKAVIELARKAAGAADADSAVRYAEAAAYLLDAIANYRELDRA